MTIHELIEKLQEMEKDIPQDTECFVQIGLRQEIATRIEFLPETKDEYAAVIIK